MRHETGRATLRDPLDPTTAPIILKRQPKLSETTFAGLIMRLPLKRALSVLCRLVIQTALRMLVTSLVFVACVVITLRCFGIPLPSVQEVLHTFDGVSELARILS